MKRSETPVDLMVSPKSYIVKSLDYIEAERLSPRAAVRVRVRSGYKCFDSVDTFRDWQYNGMEKEIGNE